jgi:EAL domain-containing protein (putative c-di-GMP-specific phosphodiesterase class I)
VRTPSIERGADRDVRPDQHQVAPAAEPIGPRGREPEATPKQIRQDRSAQHYLIEGPLAVRLQTTVALAARALDFPVAMINILDLDVQHTISLLGVDLVISTPREDALCDLVVRSGQALTIADAAADERFAHYPAVLAGDVGSYIGVPLTGRESLVIGTVCVVDSQPRTVEPDQVLRLTEFAKVVEDQLDLMRRLQERRSRGELATAELAHGIGAGELVAWYQPIINLTTGQTVGHEALARWQHPDGSIDLPDTFIPLAEDSDLILDLDLAVLRHALADHRRWLAAAPDLRLSVNISARHLSRADSVTAIYDAVVQAGLTPETIDLELTESARLITRDRAAWGLRRLRNYGFTLWLDDFGTGWSSLDYLLTLPVQGIKIDRVMTLALGSRIGNAVTRAVAGLATDLGLLITIEGIETSRQVTIAHSLGCTQGQGYLWSRPQPLPVDLSQRPDLPMIRV